ncbi:DNRLRE domain-containing protein [Cystobacter fuscus]|uniref:CBM96 family carbohydrate-binding protein n=1 Tax=Cystobacter fuscus TaxID=43 RepID=UPI0037BE2E34
MKRESRQTYTFVPSADARVEESLPTSNFGGEDDLGADLSPRLESYLRFSVSGLKGKVTRATLRLYASDGTSDGPRLFRSGGGWTEGGLTWNNRPALLEGPVDDKGSLSSNTWVEFDVTSLVRGNGELNFALVATSGNGTDFGSRESSGELRPQLIVTVEPPAPPPASCLPITDTYVQSSSPHEDSYVSQSEPDRNFGESTALWVDGSPRLESYLKFWPYSEGLAIRAARLEFTAIEGTSDGPRLYRAGDDWTESGLTWNNRPPLLGEVLGDLGAIGPNTRVSYDVTSVVTQQQDYSFALLPDSSDGVDFYSNESIQGERFPMLSVSLESPPFCSYRGEGTGGHTEWVRQYGGVGAESVKQVAPHPEGGFVAAGRFGDVVFAEDEGLALASYTADGTPLWTSVVATEDVEVTDITLTPLGNILVVGRYHNAPDLGTGPLPSAPGTGSSMAGFFIARFSPVGAPVWAHGFVARNAAGVLQHVNPQTVATDANGSLLVTGGFSGRMDLGTGLLDSGSTDESRITGGFVAKFSWEGQPLWSRALRTHMKDDVQGWAVASDAAGNVLLGGSASALTDLGDGPLGEDGLADKRMPFLAKYTPSGGLLWKRVFSGTAGEVRAIQPQGTDRIAFSANIAGTFTFAGQSYVGDFLELTAASGFLGAMTATGGDTWLRGVGYPVYLDELAVGSDGSLVLSGMGEDTFDVGGGELGINKPEVYFSTYRPFVARYTAQGEHLWSRAFELNRSLDVALLTDGGVVRGITLRAELRLDGRTFTPVGDSDLLYLKLRP